MESSSRIRRRPLSRDTYAILVALSDANGTGAELQRRTLGDSVGVYISSRSIYSILDRLEEMGLIEPVHGGYGLTGKGWGMLTRETRIYEGLVQHAKTRVVAGGHGRW